METDKQPNIDLKSGPGFNPWLAIWTEPRATISKIVGSNPNRSLWLLASIYGFSSLLNSFQTFVVGHQVGLLQIFLLALVLSPLWGYAGFSVWSFFVSVTGKLLRGTGSYKAIRAAYAWSCVPLIVNVAIWLILGAYFGRTLFMAVEAGQPLTQMEMLLLFAVMIVRLVTMVWSLIIYVNALSEVQKFSVLRAVGNLFLAGLFVCAICYVLLMVATHNFSTATAFIPALRF